MPLLPAAADEVRGLVEAAARQRGHSLIGSDLRLFAESRTTQLPDPDEAPGPISPFAFGRAYELALSSESRRRGGVHLTPDVIARGLCDLLPTPSPATTFLDPAVGGGAFLLAAAERLLECGAPAASVPTQLHGFDIDPGAVAVAEAAVAVWGLDHGVEPRPVPGLRIGDGLLDSLPPADRVVGNPPFLNQLRRTSAHSKQRRSALRERWGDLVGTYTDDAWLFLAASVEALRPGGATALVQPVSLLAARHAATIREAVAEQCTMRALWVAAEKVFDAQVQVCGVVFEAEPPDGGETQPNGGETQPDGGAESPNDGRRVLRFRGAAFEPLPDAVAPSPASWGSAAAAAVGAPDVHLPATRRRLRHLATATAGFRDQFYGFVPFVREADAGADAFAVPMTPGVVDDVAPLVTVGMIDPLRLAWGERDFTFARSPFRSPVIDLRRLEVENPTLASWTRARRRPKLLMATQTRIIEVWVDETGAAVPATPVISIEPLDPDPEILWRLAAALTAPSLTAHFFATGFGTAMSLHALKLAARDVLEAPLPGDDGAWSAAASIVRSAATGSERFDLRVVGSAADVAFAVDNVAVLDWWCGRSPKR